jgi:probable phosphoglycerate mutase
MTYTEILLIRHGETVWNVEERYQGQLDSPLTPLGISQAQAVAERLCQEHFTHLYASDLGRAYNTAKAIAARTGHAILTDSRLREKHGGVIQGMNHAEVQLHQPEISTLYQARLPDYVIPGGESTRAVLARSMACLSELVARHPSERLVVVTHGGVLSVVLRHVLGIPLETPRRFALPNAAIHTISYTSQGWRVILHTLIEQRAQFHRVHAQINPMLTERLKFVLDLAPLIMWMIMRIACSIGSLSARSKQKLLEIFCRRRYNVKDNEL